MYLNTKSFACLVTIMFGLLRKPNQIESAYHNRPIIIPRKFTLASNYFGFKLLNQLNSDNNQLKDENRKNTLISPVTICSTLLMLQLGTEPNSASLKQLNNVLALKMANIENSGSVEDKFKIKESIRKIMTKIADLKTNRVLMANETLKINLEYANLIHEYFNTDIIINQFSNNFKIVNETSIVETIPESKEGIAIFDTAYFQGSWLHQFDITNTQPGSFFGANHATYKNVPFMRLKAPVAVVPMDEIDAAMIELPFKDQRYAFYAILPARLNDNLLMIRKSLNPWYIESTIRRLNVYGKIMIELPTFGVEAEFDLRKTLEQMGINYIFKQSIANLTINDYKDSIFVDNIKHKVSMEVGESGLGSVDSLPEKQKFGKLSLNSKGASLAFNHPFLYFVRHTRTGTILLIGEIHTF